MLDRSFQTTGASSACRLSIIAVHCDTLHTKMPGTMGKTNIPTNAPSAKADKHLSIFQLVMAPLRTVPPASIQTRARLCYPTMSHDDTTLHYHTTLQTCAKPNYQPRSHATLTAPPIISLPPPRIAVPLAPSVTPSARRAASCSSVSWLRSRVICGPRNHFRASMK